MAKETEETKWVGTNQEAKDILFSDKMQLFLTLRFKEYMPKQEDIMLRIARVMQEIMEDEMPSLMKEDDKKKTK